MIVLDANVFLHAYNVDVPQHRAVSRWMGKLVESNEIIGLPWITLWAFIRVSTNPRVWNHPMAAKRVFGIVDEWLGQPGVVTLHPGPRHREILEELITRHDVSGPLVTDAVLAAIAIENGATVASCDQDFRRFPELRWVNPLDE